MMTTEERRDYELTMKNIARFLSIRTIGENGMRLPGDRLDEIKVLADAYLKLSKAGLLREIDPDKISPEILGQL